MSAHEKFQEQEAVTGSSDKAFGITIAAALIIFALARTYIFNTLDLFSLTLLAVAVLLSSLSFFKPEVLRPLNNLWFKLGMILFKITSPIILFMIYVLTIFPVGILLRLSGKNLLSLEWNKRSNSYWSVRDKTESSMKNQF